MTKRGTSRRAGRSLLVLVATLLIVAACGDDSDSTDGSGSAAGSPTTVAAANSEAFPVTFETMFGTSVIEAKPERVVSVGYTEGDLILALGVTPVAIRDWYGDQPNGLWPWAAASPAAQAGTIEVLPSAELNFEQIAGLRPDVIFAIGSGIEQADFDKLSDIAPVVAQTDEYNQFGTPWDVAQIMIGKALGLEAEAQTLVDDIGQQITEIADAHPQWQTLSGAVAAINLDGSSGAFTDGDNRGHMLTQLGFTIPDAITEIAGETFYADISAEQIELIDTDLLLYTAYPTSDRAKIDALPLVQGLDAISEGRSVFLDDETGGAMAFSSTLSIPYALDALVGPIETALGNGGGDR